MYDDELEALETVITGDVFNDDKTLLEESFDYSPLQVMPKLAVFPKNSADICTLVGYVSERKATQPELSITARSAGIDETGGPLNESIILDTGKYLNALVQL